MLWKQCTNLKRYLTNQKQIVWETIVFILLGFLASGCGLQLGTDYLSPSATSPSYEHPLGSQLISSGQFTIYSPYPEEDFRFKGQLHCHTNASDGNNTPQEVVETYRSLGYDFVAITDHDLVTQDPEVPGILFIPGVEESSSSGHILGIGVQRQTDEMRPNKVIGHIQEQGGIAIYAHPNRLPLLGGWSLGGLLSNPGACSIEVLNRGTNSEDKWDSLLTRGYQVWGTVGDDYHMTNSIIKNTNRWVVVAAPDLREESIVAALQNGHFYSTEGPDLSVKVYPWGMTVSTSAEATIEWIARGGVKRKVTQGVKEDSYFIEGDERYVRAVVIRESDKKRALGQPVFIE